MQSYVCTCCGKDKPGVPLSYGAPAPYYVQTMSRREIRKRVNMNSGTCIIDNELFFLRGSICIPVNDIQDTFEWGVWVQITEEDFDMMGEYWTTPGRESIVPYTYGRLASHMPIYPETLNMDLLVQTGPVNHIPHFALKRSNHPLAVEQDKGITMERVHEIARLLA